MLQWLTQCSSSFMHETGEKKTKEPTDAVTREDELLREDFKAQICVENKRKEKRKAQSKEFLKYMCLSSCHLYAQKPSRASIFYNKVQISKHGIPSPINLVDSYLARLLTSSALRRPQCTLSFVFCRNRLACLFSSLIGLAKSFPSYQVWLKNATSSKKCFQNSTLTLHIKNNFSPSLESL